MALSTFLFADANLRITDVGLHGYVGTPCGVRLVVRNPSSQAQAIQVQVAVVGDLSTSTVTSDISLGGGEERQLDVPVPISAGGTKITADAFAGGSRVGHDLYDKPRWSNGLVVLMCASEDTCKNAQAQIEFSGDINERADKNRNLRFEVVGDPREDWWGYSPASAVVLVAPLAKFTSSQRNALEGYLRRGGRLVLVENEIANPDFLSAYRTRSATLQGERVGNGMLFRVSSLSAKQLGAIFVGPTLPGLLQPAAFGSTYQTDLLLRRFATTFHFPRLRWMLIWLATYVILIGIVNFAVLRRLRRLEWGWISMCVLALLFAVGFYASGASRRPKDFRLDNLATYYLDSRSPLAAANYQLRISAPKRQNAVVSVSDPALFASPNFNESESNSQIWTEMNQQVARATRQYDIHLGPPRQIEISLLKWSFRDLNMEGLRELPGTMHFVGPNRLRNDTGQHFADAVYLDRDGNALYPLGDLSPGEEIQLDRITTTPIWTKGDRQSLNIATLDQNKASLQQMAVTGLLPAASGGSVFVGYSDGPALPVQLSIAHQENVHSLIIVALEQP